MLEIMQRTPLWVFPLFLFLLLRGWQARRERYVSPYAAVLLPLAMCCWSLSGAFSMKGEALLSYLVALLLSLTMCLYGGYARKITVDMSSRLVKMPRDCSMLLLLGTNFMVHFAMGVIQAQAPQLLLLPTVTVGVAAVYGGFFGVFAARLVIITQRVVRPRWVGV